MVHPGNQVHFDKAKTMIRQDAFRHNIECSFSNVTCIVAALRTQYTAAGCPRAKQKKMYLNMLWV